jgi:hypothetical protein
MKPAREELDDYAKIQGWNTNKLIGWSECADFANFYAEQALQFADELIKQEEETRQ